MIPHPTRHPELRRQVIVSLLAVVAFLAVGAGCAIPQDAEPQLIAKESVPAPILRPSTTTTVAEAATRASAIYLVKPGAGTAFSLVEAEVQVPIPADAREFPKAVLERLIGFGEKELTDLSAGGEPLENRVPRDRVTIRSARQEGSTLLVDIAGLEVVEGPSLRSAFAQIVFTATFLSGIESVRFFDNGSGLSISLEGGDTERGAPVDRDDFPSLLDSGAPSTTTTTSTTTPPPPAESLPAVDGPVLSNESPQPSTVPS